MELKALQKIQKSIEDLRIEQYHGLSIETMDTKLHSIEMEVFKLMDKVCEGKADSTSEKDLRVCEVIENASYIVQKGVNAMYDELIDKHLNVLRQQPFTSSVQYFVETGNVSGSFLLQLRKLLKEHDEICQAAK